MDAWRLVGALAVVSLGCSTNPVPACITVDASCAPLYAPTFDNVYTTTLKNTCGSDVHACHAALGASGLSFATEDTAYAELRDGQVTPGDPGCSPMIVRTSSVGARYQMPPGDPLSPQERCALVQWVKAGAPGPGAPP
jgi:hypothetical protein